VQFVVKSRLNVLPVVLAVVVDHSKLLEPWRLLLGISLPFFAEVFEDSYIFLLEFIEGLVVLPKECLVRELLDVKPLEKLIN
jgi:hypothetical protein